MAVGLVVAGMAGITDAVLLDDHGLFDGMDGVLELIAGVGLLVAHDTFLAELHLLGQAVIGFQLIFGNVGCVFGIVDINITGQFIHEGSFLSANKKSAAHTGISCMRGAVALLRYWGL